MTRHPPVDRRIFTIGHGARPVDELIADLRSAGVRALIDVRTAPGSRRHPEFGRDALSTALASNGIEYEWRKDLGGFRRPRPDSPNTAIRNETFRGYADHMSSGDFEAGLRKLEELAGSAPTAVMCAEGDWRRCHRRLIADVLVGRGWRVLHILAGSRVERHQTTPFAVGEGVAITYPPAQQELG